MYSNYPIKLLCIKFIDPKILYDKGIFLLWYKKIHLFLADLMEISMLIS